MKYKFETEDGATFVLDLMNMRWGRVSTILAAPSVKAVENDAFTYNMLEEGDLIPMGGGVYTLQGRTMKTGMEDPKNPKVGARLCAVGIIVVPYGDAINFYLRANVPLVETSFTSSLSALKSGDLKLTYHIIQANHPVPETIVQPPPPAPTVEDVASQSEG